MLAFASWDIFSPLGSSAFLAGGLPRACGVLRLHAAGPHRGYHVPHWSRRERGGCPLYPGVEVSPRPSSRKDRLPAEPSRDLPLDPTLPSKPFRQAADHGASSRVHWRSPVRSSPRPVAGFGFQLPWASPRASHPAVTSDACRGQEQASDTSQGLSATQPKRPRVAPGVAAV
jgi:hypothetical protein